MLTAKTAGPGREPGNVQFQTTTMTTRMFGDIVTATLFRHAKGSRKTHY
jgi:hypothetical protein